MLLVNYIANNNNKLLLLSIGNKITAKEFNLDAYKSWPLDLNLTLMEKKALLSLLAIKN